MNCMSKKVCQRKTEMAYEREKAEEEKYLNSLSQEERDAYNKQMEERRRQVMQFVATAGTISAMTGGPYTSQLIK